MCPLHAWPNLNTRWITRIVECNRFCLALLHILLFEHRFIHFACGTKHTYTMALLRCYEYLKTTVYKKPTVKCSDVMGQWVLCTLSIRFSICAYVRQITTDVCGNATVVNMSLSRHKCHSEVLI